MTEDFSTVSPVAKDGTEMQTQNFGRKIRIAYVTSPSELASEGAGTDPLIEPTLPYLQNAITNSPYLNRMNLEIAAVFVDDDGRERGRGKGREDAQEQSRTFEYIRSFCQENGIAFGMELSREWRHIPLSERAAREKGKKEYEEKMLSFMRQNEIDLIISDSYVVLFNSVMLDQKRGYPGLIINIHPGIASEVPGVHPTRDALNRRNLFTHNREEQERVIAQLAKEVLELAIARDGCDDSIKNVLGKMDINYRMENGMTLIERNGKPIFRATTGATLHVVDEEIDHGPCILMSTGTPVREAASEHELRVDNYSTKNMVLRNGLRSFLVSEKWGAMQRIIENRVKNDAFNGDALKRPRMIAQTIDSANTTNRAARRVI